jgi:hypothetical protein
MFSSLRSKAAFQNDARSYLGRPVGKNRILVELDANDRQRGEGKCGYP